MHAFKHREDIPLTEFIYRLENSVVSSNREWAQACSVGTVDAAREVLGLPEQATTGSPAVDAVVGVALALVVLLSMFFAVKIVRRRGAVRLAGPEVRTKRHLHSHPSFSHARQWCSPRSTSPLLPRSAPIPRVPSGTEWASLSVLWATMERTLGESRMDLSGMDWAVGAADSWNLV